MKNSKKMDIPIDSMLQFYGKRYAFDADVLSKHITINGGITQEIHIPKYELYKSLIEVVISPMDEPDDGGDTELKRIRGEINSNMPFDFKLAFNTLIKDGILKIYE
jgi:hypothetical protein